MITIESTKSKPNFIVGLYKTMGKAEKVYQNISQKENFKIIDKNDILFPFFIYEKGNKFTYCQNKEDIKSILTKIKIIDKNDDDAEYGTLYIIHKEVISKKPEIDNMGEWEHYHIENKELKNIDKFISVF